jgi:hypothetical protein
VAQDVVGAGLGAGVEGVGQELAEVEDFAHDLAAFAEGQKG